MRITWGIAGMVAVIFLEGCLSPVQPNTTTSIRFTPAPIDQMTIFVNGISIRNLSTQELRNLKQFDTGINDGGGPNGVLLSDVLSYVGIKDFKEITFKGKNRRNNEEVSETLSRDLVYDSRYNVSLKYTSLKDFKLVAPGTPQYSMKRLSRGLSQQFIVWRSKPEFLMQRK